MAGLALAHAGGVGGGRARFEGYVVSGKITEAQLDLQRRFITERLESARAKLDDYLVQETSGAEKRRLMEEVLTWAREFGQGLDEVTPEERQDYLQALVEEVVIDRDNNVDITLALPIDDNSHEPESPETGAPEPECVLIGSQEPSFFGINKHGKLRYSWAVGLGPFKPGRTFRADCPH